jgi:hypothetical protein
VVPEVNPVNAEVDEAELSVGVLVAVGVEAQVKAPEAFVTPLVARQKYIAVEAPFAVTEPFNVAVVAPMDVGSFVVAIGGPATIVSASTLPDEVVGWLSVTVKVKLVAEAVAAGVPEITPVAVFKESPDGKVPDVNAQEL